MRPEQKAAPWVAVAWYRVGTEGQDGGLFGASIHRTLRVDEVNAKPNPGDPITVARDVMIDTITACLMRFVDYMDYNEALVFQSRIDADIAFMGTLADLSQTPAQYAAKEWKSFPAHCEHCDTIRSCGDFWAHAEGDVDMGDLECPACRQRGAYMVDLSDAGDENGEPVFGWEAGRAKCRVCDYAYVAVFHESARNILECPRCGQVAIGVESERGE